MAPKEPEKPFNPALHVHSDYDGVRNCPQCEDSKPLTEAHWSKDAYGPDGVWHVICRECKAKNKRDLVLKRQLAELNTVKQQLRKKVISGDVKAKGHPSRSELAEELVNRWGDHSTIIEDLIADYRASSPGSPVRQKYFALILGVLDKAAEEAPTKKVEDMSEEELQMAIISLAEAQVERQHAGRVRAADQSESAVGGTPEG